MAKNTRTTAQREADLVSIARMYCQGMTHYEISKQIGVSRQQIAYDLKEIQKRWRESAVRDFDAAKAEELAKIDNLEREYWEAWRRSIGEKQRATTERKTGEKAYERAQIQKHEEAGDPRFLDGVARCIDSRCKLLGLVTNKVDANLSVLTWADLVKAASPDAP